MIESRDHPWALDQRSFDPELPSGLSLRVEDRPKRERAIFQPAAAGWRRARTATNLHIIGDDEGSRIKAER
jgi:hypothetical protein